MKHYVERHTTQMCKYCLIMNHLKHMLIHPLGWWTITDSIHFNGNYIPILILVANSILCKPMSTLTFTIFSNHSKENVFKGWLIKSKMYTFTNHRFIRSFMSTARDYSNIFSSPMKNSFGLIIHNINWHFFFP